MKRYTVAIILTLATTLSAPALAEPTPKAGSEADVDALDKLDDVTVYLVAPGFLASRSELRRIDADPVPELVSIASDRKKKPFVRERAIKCMSLYHDSRAKAGFASLLTNASDRYVGLVVLAYLEAFGEDAVSDVKPLLAHRKSAVRATVVKGLGTFGGQEGYDLLLERQKDERDPQVQAQILTFVQ